MLFTGLFRFRYISTYLSVYLYNHLARNWHLTQRTKGHSRRGKIEGKRLLLDHCRRTRLLTISFFSVSLNTREQFSMPSKAKHYLPTWHKNIINFISFLGKYMTIKKHTTGFHLVRGPRVSPGQTSYIYMKTQGILRTPSTLSSLVCLTFGAFVDFNSVEHHLCF